MTTNLTVKKVNNKVGYDTVCLESDPIQVESVLGNIIKTEVLWMKTTDVFEEDQVLEDIDLSKLKLETSEYIATENGVSAKQSTTWIVG